MVSLEAQCKVADLFAAATTAFVAGKRVSPSLGKGRSYDPYPAIDAVTFDQRVQSILNLYDWQVTQVHLTSNGATSGSQPVVEDGQITLDLLAREGIVLSVAQT